MPLIQTSWPDGPITIPAHARARAERLRRVASEFEERDAMLRDAALEMAATYEVMANELEAKEPAPG